MEVKVYKFCRACMVEDQTTQLSEFMKMTDNIIEMFTYCTSIKVDKDDGLPSRLCLQCMDNIHNCFNFINVCKSTDINLRNYFKEEQPVNSYEEKTTEIKEESFNSDNDDDIDNDTSDYSGLLKEDEMKREHENYPLDITTHAESKANRIGISLKKLKSGKLKVKGKLKKLKKKRDGETGVDKPLKPYKELKKEYSCPVCELTIKGKRALSMHLAKQHEEYKKFVCEFCKKGFARSHYLTQHLIIHTDQRPFACDLCPKTYKQRGQLITHRRLHTHERPYSCDKCGMNFNMKCALVNHSRLHHGDEPNLCHLCGASFAQIGNLVVHMRVHTGEKPYSCSLCPFRCSVQSGMRRHERTHENLRAYVCNVCQKGFNNSSSLKRHQRIHTGELPYKCEFCPKAFIDNWKRKNHLVKTHNMSLDTIPHMIPGRKRTYVKKEAESMFKTS